ncbi:unnamed protein product, partial [Rotaria socialis]
QLDARIFDIGHEENDALDSSLLTDKNLRTQKQTTLNEL